MPLPAMIAAHDIKDVIEQGNYLGRVDVGDPTIWILRFEMTGGVERWAVWSTTPMEFTQRRWDSPIVGQAILHLKHNIKQGKPQAMKVSQIGGMALTRSWGQRVERNANKFDYSQMNLPIGPMPIFIEADFANIKIQGITPPINKVKDGAGDDLHGDI